MMMTARCKEGTHDICFIHVLYTTINTTPVHYNATPQYQINHRLVITSGGSEDLAWS